MYYPKLRTTLFGFGKLGGPFGAIEVSIDDTQPDTRHWAHSTLEHSTLSIPRKKSAATPELPMTEVESRSNIPSMNHSLWLAVVTITTVGYGDYFPKSLPGYVIVSFLTLTSVLLLGAKQPALLLAQKQEKMCQMVPEKIAKGSSGNIASLITRQTKVNLIFEGGTVGPNPPCENDTPCTDRHGRCTKAEDFFCF